MRKHLKRLPLLKKSSSSSQKACAPRPQNKTATETAGQAPEKGKGEKEPKRPARSSL